jgi:hypothetical protein
LSTGTIFASDICQMVRLQLTAALFFLNRKRLCQQPAHADQRQEGSPFVIFAYVHRFRKNYMDFVSKKTEIIRSRNSIMSNAGRSIAARQASGNQVSSMLNPVRGYR